ncbi:MAG: hydroxymethylglutaryl-CoA synthase [Patescibacteria group bacterium]
MTEIKVGISQIGVVIPEHFILAEKIARLRGLDSEYPTKGLGVKACRIPYDISLEELVVQALKQIDNSGVEMIFFATESDSNMSKPMAVRVLGELGITVVPIQLKFACLAGLQALILACHVVASNGKPAIVIAVDRSIYREDDPKAEVTEGCAAVAMRVEINPELLALDYLHYGQYAQDIDDFSIPHKTAPFPHLGQDGILTTPTFLKCVKLSVEDWKTKNPEFGPIKDNLDYFLVHTPFPKMVEWYMAMFWSYEKYGQEEHLTIEDCVKDPNLFKEYKKKIDETRKQDSEFQDFFEKKVKPGLKYNPRIGNPYTVSIFLCLIAILEQAKEGQKIGLLGYGSGAGSMVVKAKIIKSGFKSNLQEQIQEGKELTPDEYEDWRERTVRQIRQ